jgi:uncharacterized protein (TIGR03000 family)
MYSVILMAALTTGGQTPDWHNGSRSGFSVGHDRTSGNCYGSCYGNNGIDDYRTGYGAGYGTGYGAAYGSCAGTGWGGYYPWDYSSSGCSGCAGSYGAGSPYFVTPVAPPAAQPPVREETVPLPKKLGQESLAPHKARLIVEVPADSKVYVDDQAMKTPSETRVYQTPDLEPGQIYYYEVRVEMERDGKVISETKRVVLRAGQEVLADFKDMATTATAKAQ